MKRALVCLSLLLAVPALARSHKKSTKSTSSYHCTKDGDAVASAKSSKACKKAGGTWEKKSSF